MRKRSRNPASKESSGLREKAKGGLPDGALALFNKLGLGRSLWIFPWQQPVGGTGEIGRSLWIHPWQQPVENQKDRANHFGSESLVDSSRRADPGGIEGR